MRTFGICVFLLAAIPVSGCVRYQYIVEITPEADVVQRQLTWWKEDQKGPKESATTTLPADELDRIAKLYETRKPIDSKKQVFAGRFQGDMPSDVGGAGWYTRSETSLGTLSAYVERFRGNDDIEVHLSERRAAADQLAELLIGWLESELGHDPRFKNLRRFLDQNLRTDLRNLALYAWTAETLQEHNVDVTHEYAIRIAQYLIERDYLTYRQLPVAVAALSSDKAERVTRWIQRLVARKMGVRDDQPIPESLAFLGDPQRLSASLAGYVRTTEFYKRQLRSQQADRGADAQPPDPLSMVAELATKHLLGFSFDAYDNLTVKLHTDTEPFATNGQWDAKTGVITWSERLTSERALPVVCFAVWSCPDKATQETHFGSVMLTGQELADYIVWFRGLTPQEARQWNSFLKSCKPGDELKPALRSFRFESRTPPAHDVSDGEKPCELADPARQLILKGLEEAAQRAHPR